MSAQEVVTLLKALHQTITCAESLTGGALTSEIVSVPGASHVLKGSLVAYSSEVKIQELEVSPDLIENQGVVSEEVAFAMADGARKKFHSDWAISLTGVAGPGASHGVAAGQVWLAVVGPDHRESVRLELSGGRESVRRGAVESAVGVLERILSASAAQVAARLTAGNLD